MRTRCFVVALAAILLSGCSDWAQPWFGPSHTRYNPDETTLTAANIDQAQPLWTNTAQQPIIAGARGFTTFSTGDTIGVRAFDVATGDQLWETTLATGLPAPYIQRAAFSGSELWVPHVAADRTFEITVLDPARGGVVRTIPTGVVTSPVVTDGLTAVWREFTAPTGSAPDKLVVLDRSTDTTAWSFTFPTLPSDAPLSDGIPSMGGGRIYVNHGGLLYAFDAAGCGQRECQPLWTYNSSHRKGLPMVGDDGRVYYVEWGTGTNHGQTSLFASLHALDATGAEVGTVAVSGLGGVFDNPSATITGVAVADGVAYMLSWQQSTIPPDMATVYRLRAFDMRGGCLGDGCLLWSADVDGSSIAVGGDVLYVGTATGVVAFAADGCGAATCSSLATLPVTGVSDIAVAQGKVFASGGSSLTAFALPS